MKMKSALLLLSGILLFKGATFAQGSNGGGDNRNNYQISIGRVNEQIVVDGDLLESTWRSASAATDFWMSFPVDDERANPEIQTEVRMAYDDNFIYLGVTCHGDDSYVIQTLKRDKDFWSGDAFAVVFDPVGERTNGFVFGVNPAGVQLEMLNSGQSQRRSTDTRRPPQGINIAWDNKWFSEVKNYPDKWTIEIAIPFKTLRYDEEKGNWGINFTRSDKKSNSFHSWAPVPIQFMTIDLGYTGSLAWDTPPIKQKGNVSVIPYALGATSKNFEENTDPESNFRAGFDAKAAVTSSLNLDLTVLPDFSQVDVDEQVTNLTRFNIRLPEKRLFFLENSDIFEDFGIPPMKPFFSRRLGLDEDGNAIPILYGMRLSGNVNKNLRMGLMNLQTKETAEFLSQNYSSFALHQRIFKRSVIKGYFHNRNALQAGGADYSRAGSLEALLQSEDGRWRGFGGYGKAFTPGTSGSNYF
ncbi:MAG: carbohydrate binding family 9 domain-containing protein, partial [Cyclobacteriaceae bacterium]|nr:carbohydrate binding family 9 domain-containing protein [Cyclobacteriaceae bacterium]